MRHCTHNIKSSHQLLKHKINLFSLEIIQLVFNHKPVHKIHGRDRDDSRQRELDDYQASMWHVMSLLSKISQSQNRLLNLKMMIMEMGGTYIDVDKNICQAIPYYFAAKNNRFQKFYYQVIPIPPCNNLQVLIINNISCVVDLACNKNIEFFVAENIVPQQLLGYSCIFEYIVVNIPFISYCALHLPMCWKCWMQSHCGTIPTSIETIREMLRVSDALLSQFVQIGYMRSYHQERSKTGMSPSEATAKYNNENKLKNFYPHWQKEANP